MSNASVFFYLFVFFALVGWGIECLFRSTMQKKFVNPGFLKGPYLPIYGTTAVILASIIFAIPDGTIFSYIARSMPLVYLELGTLDVHYLPIMVFFSIGIFFLVTSGIELVTGFFFGVLLRRPLWDYSDQPLCFKNQICLKYSCCWVLLAFFFKYVLLPFSLFVYRSFNPHSVFAFSLIICCVISIDFIWSLLTVLQIRRREVIHSIDDNEFMSILKPLLDKEQVQRLSEFSHHGFNTRLEHSLEVSWYSYVVAKTFSLDYTSTARGALLHDLFFYDWMTDGPRLHGCRHPEISLQNAINIINLNDKEKDIIKKHMWPLTFMPPRYLESCLVCFVDTFCSIKDCIVLARNIYAG